MNSELRWSWVILLAFVVSCGAQKSQKSDRGMERAADSPDGERAALEGEATAVGADDSLEEQPVMPRPPGLHDLIRGNQSFAFDMHKAVDDTDIIYSPHSISMVFGSLYAGAGGQTREQIAQVMHYESVAESQLHSQFHKLMGELAAREKEDEANERGFRLKVSNGLWSAEGLRFATEFQRVAEQEYLMTPQALDFLHQPEEARAKINDFVEQSTASKIKDFLPPGSIARDTRVVLTNAVYFNAAWLKPFSKSQTEDAEFQTPDGPRTRPFMRQLSRFRYLEKDGYKMIELPYAGHEVSAYVVLPDAGSYDRIDRSLTPQKFGWMIGQLRDKRVDLRLPRFSMRSKLELSEMLKGMGLNRPFSEEADFSAMFARTDERVVISKVLHEGFLSVDEAGTEAAAATGAIMRPTGGSLEAPVEFHADRPFTFFVVDKPTNAILLVARVSNPRI